LEDAGADKGSVEDGMGSLDELAGSGWLGCSCTLWGWKLGLSGRYPLSAARAIRSSSHSVTGSRCSGWGKMMVDRQMGGGRDGGEAGAGSGVEGSVGVGE
jgi:hypothetical protein